MLHEYIGLGRRNRSGNRFGNRWKRSSGPGERVPGGTSGNFFIAQINTERTFRGRGRLTTDRENVYDKK